MRKTLVCCWQAPALVSVLVCCAPAEEHTATHNAASGAATTVGATIQAEQAAAAQTAESIAPACPPIDPCANMCCVLVILAEPESREYVITKQDKEEAKKAGKDVFVYLFAESALNVARFNRLDPRFAYAGRKIRVPELPPETLYTPMPERYDPALQSPKYILIDLNKQFLGLYECGYLAASYPISSGQEGHRTPPGDTSVMTKVVNHKSSVYPEPYGGAPMPHALRIRGWSYWMHGGDLVGYPASHGCIREMFEDAKKVFSWADIGTPVRIVKKLN